MLDPFSPDGQGDRSNYRVPIHRTAQILTQSKNSDKAVFHAENATLLSKSAVFALRTHASRVVGGLQGGHGKPNLLMGAVPARCRNAPLVSAAELSVSCHAPTRGRSWRRQCFFFFKVQGPHRPLPRTCTACPLRIFCPLGVPYGPAQVDVTGRVTGVKGRHFEAPWGARVLTDSGFFGRPTGR